MSALQIPGTGDAPALVEREVLGTLLDVNTAELSYEDGTTLEQATRDLRARLFSEQTVAQIAPPVMLSAAIAAAHRSAVSLDMARKLEGTGKCMLAFGGDMPLELFLERENILDFLLWLRRLPKPHGKNHKRNKYSRIGMSPTSTSPLPSRTNRTVRSSMKSAPAPISTCAPSAPNSRNVLSRV